MLTSTHTYNRIQYSYTGTWGRTHLHTMTHSTPHPCSFLLAVPTARFLPLPPMQVPVSACVFVSVTVWTCVVVCTELCTGVTVTRRSEGCVLGVCLWRCIVNVSPGHLETVGRRECSVGQPGECDCRGVCWGGGCVCEQPV